MEIKVALCEDMAADQKEVELYLEQWAATRGYSLTLNIFPHTDRLLGEIGEDIERYDIYILDIEMRSEQEGLDFARNIRRLSKHIPIIFITSHLGLSYDSYDVYALSFIAKPLSKSSSANRLFSAMDILASELEQKQVVFFNCSIDGVSRRILLYEILYFEADRNYIKLNGDDNLRTRLKLSESISQHPEAFVQCHRSYAVNLAHVRGIKFSEPSLSLSDGTGLPIGAAFLDAVWERFEGFRGLSRKGR